MKGLLAKQAYHNIIKNIKIFERKPDHFYWYFLPKLRQMNFFAGEYLYIQNEHADEVYFILKGKVKLLYDLTEGEIPKPYNIPFNMYVEGSYFGDSDVLVDKDREITGRDGTALVDAESMIYVMTRKDLYSVLRHFKDTFLKEMYFIANERYLHHLAAIEELKL